VEEQVGLVAHERQVADDHPRRERRSRVKPPASPALALIIAAPFSAIMLVGALVFVELTAGITEASTTRSASSPWTGAGHRPPTCRDCPSCTSSSRGRRSSRSNERNRAAVSLCTLGPGAFSSMMYSASAGEQAPQEFEPADDRALIGLLGEVAWVDRRLVVRVGRAD
jgi:hypothetical protein